MMGAASFAAFTSANTNTGNTFGAGTLTLEINGSAPTSTGVFTTSDAKPGDVVGPKILDLKNTGSVDASDIILTGITVNPTVPTVTPTPSPLPNLGDVLTLQLYNDDGTTPGVVDIGDHLLGQAHLTSAGWTSLDLHIPLAHGATVQLLAVITFDSGAGNVYQGTGVSFDMTFQATT